MLRIGIISATPHPFSKSLSANKTFFHFGFATSSPTFSSIFDSAMSPPSRYLEEMYVRLTMLSHEGEPPGIFLFNPFFEFSRLEISATLSRMPCRSENVVFADRRGKPIGYYFGQPIAAEATHLIRLLSTCDGALDAAILEHLFSTRTSVEEIRDIRLNPNKTNGFSKFNEPVFAWLSRHTLALLKRGLKPAPDNLMAIMPYHAGDVLFTALAFRWVNAPFKALAINNSYVPIARHIDPDLSIASLPGHAYFRQPNKPSTPDGREWDHFLSTTDELPGEKFLIYMRPSRNYNETVFHLIDHSAFALGRRFFDIDTSVAARLPVIARAQPPVSARRVLIHLDAGWPLKIYPHDRQQKLIDRLSDAGFSVTVLVGDAPSLLHGCKVVRFESLERLGALMNEQSLVIGMDSFPAHWASFALGIPTITVFGSTRKQNSQPHPNSFSESLDRGLSCCPCLHWNSCPAFGGTDCQNFIGVDELVQAAIRITANSSSAMPALRRAGTEAIDRDPNPDFDEDPDYELPSALVRSRLLLRRPMTSPHMFLASQLARGFVQEYRNAGLVASLRKAVRFISRRLLASGNKL